MGKRSYADILRLYNKAWSLREKGLRKLENGDKSEASRLLLAALLEMLRVLALYAGRIPYGISDPVYLASILLDEGLVDSKTYSLIVEAELSGGENIGAILKALEIVDKKIKSLDPYIGGQARLFRY